MGAGAAAKSHERRKTGVMSAVMFALMWTAGMLWWFDPAPGLVHPALLAVAGLATGVAWCWMHGRHWRSIE